MQKIIFSILTILSLYSVEAQPALKKYPIGNSGCQTYMYCDPGTPNVSFSDDSSVVYTMECRFGELSHGLICVQFKEAITDITVAESVMISYMDYLKTSFKVKESAGYGKGHQLSGNNKATGVIDFWKDEEGTEWKVKSWTDGKFIGFLFAYGSKKALDDNFNRLDVFFNGFRFKP
jgi:hypothetical protein